MERAIFGRFNRAALLVVAVSFLVISGAMAFGGVPQGTWLIDGKAGVQIFDCGGTVCGRIVWLRSSRDSQDRLRRDDKNPVSILRRRPLCGLTILWGLIPDGPNRWKGGWLYNPDDGRTYAVSAQLRSADVIIARIYLGIPLFGQTKTLVRIAHGTSEGWCP